MIRSYLFVPADDRRKLDKSLQSGADALIFDLEDSVAAQRKEAGRVCLGEFLRDVRKSAAPALYIRVNDLRTGMTLADLTSVMEYRPDGIVLPKATCGDDVRTLSHFLDAFEAVYQSDRLAAKIVAIATETASSVLAADSFKDSSERLSALMWGAEDLSTDLGAMRRRTDAGWTGAFMMARTSCLFAAAKAGVVAIDAISPETRNMALVKDEANEAKLDGFAAKAAIHPAQVAPINETFTPSSEQLEWARKVVDLFAGGSGVTSLDGQMLDRPHLRLAERLLAAGSK